MNLHHIIYMVVWIFSFYFYEKKYKQTISKDKEYWGSLLLNNPIKCIDEVKQ